MSFLVPLGGAKENDEKVTGGRESPAQKVKVIREYVVIEVFPWGHASLQAPSELQLARWRQAAACTDVAPPLHGGSTDRSAQEAAPRRGEEKQLTLGNQADSLSGSGGSEDLKISCSEPPASAEQPARTLGCVDGKEPKLEDFELAILEHQAILHYSSGDGRLQVDWSAEEPTIHQPDEQPLGGDSAPVPAPGFPVPCLGGETQGQVQGGLGTGLRGGRAKGGLCKPEPLAGVSSLFGVPDTFEGVKTSQTQAPISPAVAAGMLDAVTVPSLAVGASPAQQEKRIDGESEEEEERDTGQAPAKKLTLLEELRAAGSGQSLLEELEEWEDWEDEKAGLVEKIKALQRGDQSAKRAWWVHCEVSANGTKDPSLHDVESLNSFLSKVSWH
jgi:hypothetical protein